LPKYTELGYNTFGAYYDGVVFRSDEEMPVSADYDGLATSFTFTGKLESGYMSMILTMNDFAPAEFGDLVALDEKVIDLTNSNVYTVFINNEFFSTSEKVEILDGTFNFVRARNLYIDKEHVGVILSGTFEFHGLINGESISVTNGRFDINFDGIYTSHFN
jgi:hypothetical protein